MSKLAEVDYSQYLRTERLPTTWCAGCGDGAILKSLVRALDASDLDRNETAIVSGIGCSGRMSGYLDYNTLHVTHGRTLAFVTGLKMAHPEGKVVVITGDGDCLAIGGNHFIHAARRNLDVCVIIINNYTYGLTGGQVSPESPEGTISPTAPFGSIEPVFNTAELAKAAGATLVARTVVANPLHMDRMIKTALAHKGFAVVEVLSNCHINWGRKNDHAAAYELIKYMESLTSKSQKEADETGKLLIGVLHQAERKEYTDAYAELVAKAQAKAGVR